MLRLGLRKLKTDLLSVARDVVRGSGRESGSDCFFDGMKTVVEVPGHASLYDTGTGEGHLDERIRN